MKVLGFLLASALVVAVSTQMAWPSSGSDPDTRISAHDFPTTAARAMFFEERINAKDSRIRLRVLTEVSYFYGKPDVEFTSFLGRLTCDDDPVVRGEAIRHLHDMWFPIDPCALPVVFSGYYSGQIIDRADTQLVASLMRGCNSPGPSAGYAAYVLGLLGDKSAIPALLKLSVHSNIFVRYAAGRALFDCGDVNDAYAIFDTMSSEQLSLYRLHAGNTEPYYAAVSCRGLVEAGGEDDLAGVSRMIELLGYLEDSSNPNDENVSHYVRSELAITTGTYFTVASDAKAWLVLTDHQQEK